MVHSFMNTSVNTLAMALTDRQYLPERRRGLQLGIGIMALHTHHKLRKLIELDSMGIE